MSNDPMGFDPKYDDKKTSGVIYFSKTNKKENGSSFRKVELLIDERESYLTEKNKEDNSQSVEFTIKENMTLFRSPGGQQKIQCWLMETTSGKYVQAIRISRRTGKGVYGSQDITLSFEAIFALREFMNKLFIVDTAERIKIPISSQGKRNEVSDHQRIISEKEFVDLIRANIKSIDDFYKLLSIQKIELSVERLERIIMGEYANEVEIQYFLKNNIWMFGNDYIYIVENGKINVQNILDMVPQNFESYIDIIEVKLPKEKLFNFDESHNNYYSTSHLTKAIAQTQNYIFELEKKTIDEEYLHENSCKVIRPKGIILYGAYEPLNEEEKQYLRILNSSYHNLQIITYQQLLEKAKNTLRILKENTNSKNSN